MCLAASSLANPVQNGKAWKSTNYALGHALGLLKTQERAIVTKKCPADLSGAVQSSCALVINVSALIYHTLILAMELVSAIYAKCS